MSTLTCTWCRRELPDEAFGVATARTSRRGRYDYCRECVREQRLRPRACAHCGEPTTSYKARLCVSCRREHWAGIASDRRFDHETVGYWTRERIIRAIQDFVSKRGRLPTAKEWSTGNVGRGASATPSVWGHPARRKWPSEGSVRFVFGTWNEAIKAAGFKPRKRGTRDRMRKPGAKRCVNGHPWVDPYIGPNGKAQCRACRKEASERHRRRHRNGKKWRRTKAEA